MPLSDPPGCLGFFFNALPNFSRVRGFLSECTCVRGGLSAGTGEGATGRRSPCACSSEGACVSTWSLASGMGGWEPGVCVCLGGRQHEELGTGGTRRSRSTAGEAVESGGQLRPLWVCVRLCKRRVGRTRVGVATGWTGRLWAGAAGICSVHRAEHQELGGGWGLGDSHVPVAATGDTGIRGSCWVDWVSKPTTSGIYVVYVFNEREWRMRQKCERFPKYFRLQVSDWWINQKM